MGEARTIQATDRETVIEMYDSMDVPAFAIFAKSELLFAKAPDSMEEGKQLLEKWLDWIYGSKSAALYSLRVYRKAKDDDDITNKTPYNSSINFRLHAVSMFDGGTDGNGGYIGALNQNLKEMQAEILKLHKRLDEKEEEDDDDEPGGIIGKLMDPEFIERLPILVATVKGLFAGNPQPREYHEIPQSEKLGHVSESLTSGISDDQRIDMAIAELKMHVPDLADLLTKLATMTKRPVMFKGALMILRTMKI
jgi:hypothetical protein